ncbi:hypothetical protein L1987_20825 [Smallanthus sonchifolius]|uniref:Uncharacterized protein n=1 Tax=Smallanthus sonchifolius TaxID=185202 RepID=A0ACB9ISW7_9ASTR|nr:hypothetical protein L1987_20825 [Smallanthus sonchifolius]
MKRYCPQNVVDKIESELLQFETGTMTHQEYTTKFNEMVKLVPHLVSPESRRFKWANRSFISCSFTPYLGVRPIPLIHAYGVETASGEKIRITESYPDCAINFGNDKVLVTLMPTNLNEYEVILGMDLLNQYQAQIDCDQRTVKIKKPDETSLMIQGDSNKNKIEIISIAKAKKELIKGDGIFILHALNVKPEGQIVDIPIVCDHPDVFLEELPSVPPDH